MSRAELEQYIREVYGTDGDYPWIRYPNYEVFRHAENKKWFALLLEAPRNRLCDSPDAALVEVVNVKCDPMLCGSMREERGIYQAYHMDKGHWLSVAIQEAAEDKLRFLLNMSYELTAPKEKERGRR